MPTEKPTYEELEQQIIALEQNVIALKQREDNFIRLQMELDALFNKAPVAMFIVDKERRLCKVNDAALTMTHLPKKENIGLKGGEALGCVNAFEDPRGCGYSPACEFCVIRNTIMETFKTGKDYISIEAPIPYPSENIDVEKWVLVSTSLLRLPEGDRVFVCLEDITAQKQAESALQESEERYRDMFDNNDAVMLLIDPETGDIIEANPAAGTFYGYTVAELKKKKVTDITEHSSQDLFDKIKSIKETGQKYFHVGHFPANGDSKDVEIHTSPIKMKGKTLLFTIINDVTDRKQAESEKVRLEKRLVEAQKMEAIGTLAGGVAHEFNNILSVILGNSEIALDDVMEWNTVRHCLDEIRKASLRGRDVVGNILNVARKTFYERKPINLSVIIKESLKLLRATIPAMIEIRQDIVCEKDMILGDVVEVNKVLIHLCNNAIQAIGDEIGTIEVSLKPITLDVKSVKDYEDLKPGDYVKLSVKDSGSGIDPQILDRIFEPYFSTSSIVERKGMGLAIMLGIVKKHEGAIKVKSELGKGTVFDVLFPAFKHETGNEKQKGELNNAPNFGIKILLVDDDESIIEMTEMMLLRLGCKVETKTNSLEALNFFKSNPESIDLVITDIGMPHMPGDKLAGELRKIKPDVPIILSTGYSDRIDEEKAKEMGISSFIMKPIVMNKLASAIRDVLKK